MIDIKDDLLLIDTYDPTNFYDSLSDNDLFLSDMNHDSPSDVFYDDFYEIQDIDITEFDRVSDLESIQDSFIEYIKENEMHMLGNSYVEKLFMRYNCSIDEILGKNRTELWYENSVYGLQFQAFMCLNLNVSLPTVTNRINKRDTESTSNKFYDTILEDLTNACANCPESNNVRKRLAPKDQISILIFILDILSHPYFQKCIRWQDKHSLSFEILRPKTVAYFWMIVKDNVNCSFENFTRAIRFKRNAGLFKYIDHKKRRVYQFQRKALMEYKHKRAHNRLTEALIKSLADV